ncbi:hypothetical protein GCM10010497_21040 [Streptomyces cinereoruber]|uniref:Uncharacterized protein n=1 Tax=Streptomyces cinereoruber TaxID=67260 RepID=A0AAV4KGA5_9ACTN|nr:MULTISPECIES: hypothetical protein [Streptomyces]MBB4158974.1 hypothetical protein [Streptomyces cinereoruber]MBY8816699.1 hypothetical protein [Streptomyces cinereoruber]NIH63335.1 hypothetical protein [Streptomyces cinereoruber]GGR18770.1 hypothetical protein GCM10010497_21040 [Streptomyces cinereoruber]
MRDHDTAERAAQAAPYGTDKQTAKQTDTRPGTADRGEADDRRETDGRPPAPVERDPGPAEKSAPPGPSDVRPAPLAKATGHGDDEHVPDLLGKADGDAYRERWREIQGRFVDDPREAVHSADELVADVMKTLAEAFADHKHTLEGQWSEGRDADTEDLRVALREYRSFFNRLLTTSAPQR